MLLIHCVTSVITTWYGHMINCTLDVWLIIHIINWLIIHGILIGSIVLIIYSVIPYMVIHNRFCFGYRSRDWFTPQFLALKPHIVPTGNSLLFLLVNKLAKLASDLNTTFTPAFWYIFLNFGDSPGTQDRVTREALFPSLAPVTGLTFFLLT